MKNDKTLDTLSQMLSADEIQTIRNAVKLLNKITKQYCKDRIAELYCYERSNGINGKASKIHKELEKLGVKIDIDDSASYQDAVSMRIQSKVYLISTECF